MSNFNGERILMFGGVGSNVGTFGRAVGVTVSEEGLIWVTDAMGSNIQAFNMEGEPKLAIASGYFPDENLQIAGPRGIVVKDGVIYVASERSHRILAFKYNIIKAEQ